MAVCVVELLEVVEVEHGDREVLAGAQSLVDAGIPGTAVGQARERVGAGHVGELAQFIGAVDNHRRLVCQQSNHRRMRSCLG